MTEQDLIQAFTDGESARVREIVVQHPDLARVTKDGVSILLHGSATIER